MNNKNTSKTETLTPQYMATLCNGKTKRFVLMRPNPESPIAFVKGVPVPVDHATKEHLEKNATYSKTAHFPDGSLEQTTHCSFQFTALTVDEMDIDAEPVT